MVGGLAFFIKEGFNKIPSTSARQAAIHYPGVHASRGVGLLTGDGRQHL